MNTDNGSLEFDFYLNNTRLQQTALEAERRIKGVSDTFVNEGKNMENSFGGVGTALAAIGGTAFLGMLGNKLLTVRGEFQQLDVAFTTMLGSKEKADQLMAQIVDTAAKTPFTLTEVAQGAKQLLAYQVAAEEVNDTVIRLGNISAGVSVPLGRLVTVYGQVKAKGKLMGDDLRQFSEAGIPMISELAKVMGVTDSEISKMVENGKIGFPEVQKVIQNLTDEGGMFFNLMEKQSKTITGQISNLSDAFDRMLNTIGESNDGVISSGISGLTGLVENYETVGKVLFALAATYGTYKAAVIVANAVSALQAEIAYQQILANIGNTGSTITLTTAEGVAAVAKSRLTAAQLALNNSMLSNPYVLAITALVGLAVVIYQVTSAQTEAEKATKRYNDAMDESNKKIDEEKSKSSTLISLINDEGNSREFRNQKLKELIALSPEHLNGLTLDNIKTKEGTIAINGYIEALSKKIKIQNLEKELSASDDRINKASRGTENLDWIDKANIAISTAVGNPALGAMKSVELNAKNNKAVLDAEKDLQKKLKEEINKATGGDKAPDPKSPIVKNADYWQDQVKIAQDALKKLDPQAKNYNNERKKLLNQIAQGEAESNKILGKKTKGDTSVKDNKDFDKDKLDAQKKAISEEQSLIRDGIETKIRLYDDELKQTDLSFTKEKELTQQRIDAKKELIDFDLKQTMKGIDDEEKEFIKKAKKAGVKNPDLSSFKSLRATAVSKANADKKAVELVDTQAEKEKLDELLAKFQDMKQKMFDLETDYNRDIERLQSGLLNAKTDAEKAQIQQSLDERKKQFSKDSSALSVDELMKSPDWSKLFGNLDNVTTRELIKLKDKVEGEFSNMNLDPKDLETLRQKINDITNIIEQRNPFLALSEALKKYKTDQSSVNFKEVMSDASAAIDAVGQVFDQVVGSLDKLGVKTTEQDKQVLGDIKGMMNGTATVMKGLAEGNPVDIIKGSVEYIVSAIDLIAGAKDRKLEKSIRKHKAEVDALKVSYEKLERAIDKALGSGRYSSQKATIDNLKKQQAEYAALAKAENDKKKTDSGKVQEYQNNIQDNINAIEDKIAKMREDILGMDVSSAANDLGSAIIDAFSAGEDAAAAWGDKVNDIVGDVMRKMLIQKLVEEPVGNIINKYMAQWVDSEGNFLGFDAVMNSAVQMGNELSAVGPGLSSALEALPDDIKKYITGDVSGANDNKKALSGSIKSVSEDTAGVISGQMNAMRINQIESISVLRSQLLALNQIVVNTDNLNGILTAMNTLVNGGRAHGLW
jgi:tape measure domain-containing protein